MAIWPRFHRSSEAKAAAAPEAAANERTGRESERSGGGGGGGDGGGMTGGRGVSKPLQHRRLFVPRNPPPSAPRRPHLGLKLSAPNSHFINQDDPSSCEFISLCAG